MSDSDVSRLLNMFKDLINNPILNRKEKEELVLLLLCPYLNK